MESVGYRLNRLHEPVFTVVPKSMLTEFGIHHRLESCESFTFYECSDSTQALYLSFDHSFAETLLLGIAEGVTSNYNIFIPSILYIPFPD